jgi:hypothetical protein
VRCKYAAKVSSTKNSNTASANLCAAGSVEDEF